MFDDPDNFDDLDEYTEVFNTSDQESKGSGGGGGGGGGMSLSSQQQTGVCRSSKQEPPITYTGVTCKLYTTGKKYWVASGCTGGVKGKIHIGTFTTPHEAARAYDRWAFNYFAKNPRRYKVKYNFPSEIGNFSSEKSPSGGGGGGEPPITYTGVYKHGTGKKCWAAAGYASTGGGNKKKIHIGYFTTPHEAARAYDRWAFNYFAKNPRKRMVKYNFPSEIGKFSSEKSPSGKKGSTTVKVKYRPRVTGKGKGKGKKTSKSKTSMPKSVPHITSASGYVRTTGQPQFLQGRQGQSRKSASSQSPQHLMFDDPDNFDDLDEYTEVFNTTDQESEGSGGGGGGGGGSKKPSDRAGR
jgi:hypothetical protein